MLWLRALYIISLITFVVCSTIRTQYPGKRWSPRIVGGLEIDIIEVPYQVSLQYHSTHFCGASVVGRQWILSAAHCTNGKEMEFLSVRIGTSTHASNGLTFKLKSIVYNDGYVPDGVDYDYVLLELPVPLNYTDKIQPIALPKSTEKFEEGTRCLASGWGNTQNPNESSDKLRAVDLPIGDQNKCKEQYKDLLTSRMICAGYPEGGRDTCQRDSGGPLVCEEPNSGKSRLVGVVSFGQGCASPDYLGVYARVQEIRSWIEEVTGI